MATTWDTTGAVFGQDFSAGDATYTGTQGYGQAVIATTAISGQKFWTIQAANGTASNDIEIGVSQAPLNHQSSVGGGSASNSDGKGYAYQTNHGWVQGPYDGSQITPWPYYPTSTASELIGVGFNDSTRVIEFFKWSGSAWVMFTDHLSNSDPQLVGALDAGTYYPATSCYGGQSASIDGNPAVVPAGYTALDAATAASGEQSATLSVPTQVATGEVIAIYRSASASQTLSVGAQSATGSEPVKGAASQTLAVGTQSATGANLAGMVNPTFSPLPASWQAIMPAYPGAPTPTIFVDTVSGSDSNNGLSSGAPKATFSAAVALASAGSCIGIKCGSTVIGPVFIDGISGSAGNPICVTPYGTGAAPDFGWTSNPVVNLYNDSSGLYFRDGSSYWTFDGGVQNGLKFSGSLEGGVVTNGSGTGRAAGGHFSFYNCEFDDEGLGIALDDPVGYSIIQRCYFHDGHMVVNTPTVVNDNDDYGANGVRIGGGSNNVVSFNYGLRLAAPSYDYTVDGGFIEFYVTAADNPIGSCEVAYNLVQDCMGLCEGGGDGEFGGGDYLCSMTGVNIHHNLSVNNEKFFTFHRSGAFGCTYIGCKFQNNSVIQTAAHLSGGNYAIGATYGGEGAIAEWEFSGNLVFIDQRATTQDFLSVWDIEMDASTGQVDSWHHDNVYFVPEGSGATSYSITGGQSGLHMWSNWAEGLNSSESRYLMTDLCFVDLAANDYRPVYGSNAVGFGALDAETYASASSAQTTVAPTQTATGTVADAGSGTQTLGQPATTATGLAIDKGSASQGVGLSAVVATGVSIVDGATAQTLNLASNVAAGVVLVQGTSSSTLVVPTNTAAGVVITPSLALASASQTLSGPTQAATGTVAASAQGSAALTLQEAATGVVAVAGTSSQAASSFVQVAAGLVPCACTAAQTLATLGSTGSGVGLVAASASQTSAVPTQVATAVAISPAVSGQAAQTITAPTQAATSVVAASASVAQALTVPAQTAGGVEIVKGTESTTLAVPAQTATGTPIGAPISAQASQSLSVPATVATASVTIIAAGSAALGLPVISASGVTVIKATSATTLAVVGSVGSGVGVIGISVNQAQPVCIDSGAAVAIVQGFVDVTIPVPSNDAQLRHLGPSRIVARLNGEIRRPVLQGYVRVQTIRSRA